MNRRDVLTVGLLALCLAAFLLPLASIGADDHHDGIMLKPALDVLSGQMLFRDSFSQYGLLTSCLQAVALWISPTLLAIRLLNVAAYVVTLGFLYTAWRMILPRPLAVVSCILYILFIPAYEGDYTTDSFNLLLPWSSVFAMMFQAAGLYALMRVLAGGASARWSVVLGMMCACTFWCRLPVGLAMMASLLAIGVALWRVGWQPVETTKGRVFGRVGGGFLAVNAIIIGGLVANGALGAWWDQNILWPARWVGGTKWSNTLPLTLHPVEAGALAALGVALVVPVLLRRLPSARSTGLLAGYWLGLALLVGWQHEWLWRALVVGPGGWHAFVLAVILVQAVMSLFSVIAGRQATGGPQSLQISAMAALLLGSLLQFYPVADAFHSFYSLSVGFGLFVFCLWQWSGVRAVGVAAVLALVLLPTMLAKGRAIPAVLNRPMVTLTRPAILQGMKVPPGRAQVFGQVADATEMILRHAPDTPFAMIGINALYLCFANNMANPSPYYVTWHGLARPEDNLERWRNIQAMRPVMILQGTRWDAVNDFYRRSRYVPITYVVSDGIEIAIPQELADRMGLKPYGLQPAEGGARLSDPGELASLR